MRPRVLGVIPARGNSKRVPGKNLRLLHGRPLIAWTIEAAKQAKSLTDWVVSTEDRKIADVAISYGAHVLNRPANLSRDETTSGEVLLHALDAMEIDSEPYDVVVCLHPTSPIRNPEHIDEAVGRLEHSPSGYVSSVKTLPEKRHCNVFAGHWERGGAVLNASIYAMKADALRRTGDHTSTETSWFEMDRYHSLDVDEEIDLKIAELYMSWAMAER